MGRRAVTIRLRWGCRRPSFGDLFCRSRRVLTGEKKKSVGQDTDLGGKRRRRPICRYERSGLSMDYLLGC